MKLCKKMISVDRKVSDYFYYGVYGHSSFNPARPPFNLNVFLLYYMATVFSLFFFAKKNHHQELINFEIQEVILKGCLQCQLQVSYFVSGVPKILNGSHWTHFGELINPKTYKVKNFNNKT
jgi:hypothetical protein